MAILSTIKKVMPYLKTATGYVLCRLSSQAVEMDDGTTLQESYDSLNSKIPVIQYGHIDIGNVSGNSTSTKKVEFDIPFSDAPRVVATPYVVSISPGSFEVGVTAVNSSGFTVRVTNRASGTYWVSVDWIAIL